MLARPLRPVRPVAFIIGVGLLGYAGCSSSATTSPPVTHPTMIEIAPEEFLGNVPCSSSGSGLKLYVATLFDTNGVGAAGESAGGAASAGGASSAGAPAGGTTAAEAVPGDAPAVPASLDDAGSGGAGSDQFRLPSSLPTPCRASVGFGYVVAGRLYRAEIDGYAEDNLVPRAEGSREMVIADAGGSLAKRRWKAECDATLAVDSTIVRATHCKPLEPTTTDTNSNVGSLRLALGALLNGFSCGSKAGEIQQLQVTLSTDDGQTQQQTVDCADDAEVVFTDLPPSRHVSIYVAALGAQGGAPIAGASCNADTLPDAEVDAQCAALNSMGTLRVDVPGALGLLHVGCNTTDLSSVRIDVPGEAAPRSFLPPDCLQPFDQGFAAGPAVVTLTALNPKAEQVGVLTCHAEIAPGLVARAQCEPKAP